MSSAAAYDWSQVYSKVSAQLEKSSDAVTRERYALDCAYLLSERMNDAQAYLIISKPDGDKCPWVAKKSSNGRR